MKINPHKLRTYIGMALALLILFLVLLGLWWHTWWPAHILSEHVYGDGPVHITYTRVDVAWDSPHPTLVMGTFDCSTRYCHDTPRLLCAEPAICATNVGTRMDGPELAIGRYVLPFELPQDQLERAEELTGDDRNTECSTAARTELSVSAFCINRSTGSFLFFATR